jgi:CDI immunity proteins
MDESRTLDELDPPAWGAATYDSALVQRCHELRKTPLGKFSPEDLRLMIGQEIGLDYLIPRAIATVEANPLAEGDMYPGDLLHALVRVSDGYWRVNPDQWYRVSEVIDDLSTAQESIREAIPAFRAIFS